MNLALVLCDLLAWAYVAGWRRIGAPSRSDVAERLYYLLGVPAEWIRRRHASR